MNEKQIPIDQLFEADAQQIIRVMYAQVESSPLLAYAAEVQRRQIHAVEAFNTASAGQADTMIRLTRAIAILTVILALMAGIQIWWMGKGA